MILVDAGPLIALFDPRDSEHERAARTLKSLREPLRTTVPVLTEAFYMLSPASTGADRLRDFIVRGGLGMWFMDNPAITRAFEVMEQYADHAMDFADASLVAAAEALGTRRVFTIDRRDFAAYRVRRGHRLYQFDVVM